MNQRVNRFFKWLLALSALGAIAALATFGMGMDEGGWVVFAMMAVATFPMFHFAAQWPLNRSDSKAGKKLPGEDDSSS